MVNRGFHIGTFLLFSAFVLLLVSTLTAPVFTDLDLLHVQLTNSSTIRHSSINFGVFGNCLLDGAVQPGTKPDQDFCSSKSIGYDITGIISSATGTTYVSKSINNATKILIFHPLATGILFIAFVIALLSSRIGYLFSSAIAFFGFLLASIAMIADFAIFVPIKNHINTSGSGAIASLGTCIWLTLAGTIIAFFASISTCLACVTDRKSRRDGRGLNDGSGTHLNEKY